MKHLFTISALLISSLAIGQWPSLPYNPDENGDMLIGVADLQALLANYGSEFASAVVSEDGESAIVYMGDMGYPQCKYSCDHLPGFWTLPQIEDLVPVWDDVSGWDAKSWLFKSEGNLETAFPIFQGPISSTSGNFLSTSALTSSNHCYCAAKQLPRVEYSYCRSIDEQPFSNCCQEKVENGWYPLSTTTGVSGNIYAEGEKFGQAFWRWAE